MRPLNSNNYSKIITTEKKIESLKTYIESNEYKTCLMREVKYQKSKPPY